MNAIPENKKKVTITIEHFLKPSVVYGKDYGDLEKQNKSIYKSK